MATNLSNVKRLAPFKGNEENGHKAAKLSFNYKLSLFIMQSEKEREKNVTLCL